MAGSFYPADQLELGRIIDDFLTHVPSQSPPAEKSAIKASADLRPTALIVPHAGYVYSGQTAAYAYKQLEGRSYDTVVLVGVCHRILIPGASVWRAGSWKTPLGEVPVDEDLAEAIFKESPLLGFDESAHLSEHSLEVQLPFLQKVLKNFKIVPILITNPRPEYTDVLAQAIAKHIKGKNVLLIASTDMSHYYPDPVARSMDALALGYLKKNDVEGLLKADKEKRSELCGIAPTLTVMKAAKLLNYGMPQVLNYSTTADSTGDRSRVVGYGASVIFPVSETTGVFNQDQRKKLLALARRAVETFVTTKKAPEVIAEDPAFGEPKAVFVTIREHGQLRGCIGSLSAAEPLYLAVRNKAVEAASRDPRFKPVSADELKELNYEISVLSEPKRVSDAAAVRLGQDGVIVRRGGHSGVFLPKVAEETAWSKEEFLSELCSQKAGLDRDCWKDPATEIYTFNAEEFGE